MKIFVVEILETRGSIKPFCGTNESIQTRHKNVGVASANQIEDLEHQFLEDDLCDNKDDAESANLMNFISSCVWSASLFLVVCKHEFACFLKLGGLHVILFFFY